MGEDLSIQIRAIIDAAQARSEAQSKAKEIMNAAQAEIDKRGLNLKVNTSDVNKGLKNIGKDTQQILREETAMINEANKTRLANIRNAGNEQRSVNREQSRQRIADIRAGYAEQNAIQKNANNIAIENIRQQGRLELESLKSVNKQKIAEIQALNKRALDLHKQQNTKMGQLTVDNELSRMEAYKANNSKAFTDKSFAAEFNKIYSGLKNGNLLTKEASKQFDTLTNRIDAAGKSGKVFGQVMADELKSFTRWQIASTLVMIPIKAMKDAVETVKDLDAAMVELKKVTDETAKTYDEFYKSANDSAKQLGITTKEVINSTAEWARLGYSIKEAQELAKNSAIFKNISENMSIEEATEGMVSTIKAFGMEAEDSLDGVVSKVNALGNSFALSNSDINEALMRSSAAMASANNTLDQTMALIVAGTEITQDAASMGTALKTISMRIRGMDEEGEELDGTLQNIKGDIYELTNVSIMQDANTYKDTYNILKEIAGVWDKLTDKKQSNVLELLFGKRQANVGAAILGNFEQAEKAIQVAANSAGGALIEQERAMDSIQGKSNALKETYTGIWQDLIDGEVVKGLLDIATALSGLLTIADSLPVKIVAITAAIIGLKAAFDSIKATEFGLSIANSFKSITGRDEMMSPLNMPVHTLVVTRNELVINMVLSTRVYVVMPKMV